jgi:hypothetical protein
MCNRVHWSEQQTFLNADHLSKCRPTWSRREVVIRGEILYEMMILEIKRSFSDSFTQSTLPHQQLSHTPGSWVQSFNLGKMKFATRFLVVIVLSASGLSASALSTSGQRGLSQADSQPGEEVVPPLPTRPTTQLLRIPAQRPAVTSSRAVSTRPALQRPVPTRISIRPPTQTARPRLGKIAQPQHVATPRVIATPRVGPPRVVATPRVGPPRAVATPRVVQTGHAGWGTPQPPLKPCLQCLMQCWPTGACSVLPPNQKCAAGAQCGPDGPTLPILGTCPSSTQTICIRQCFPSGSCTYLNAGHSCAPGATCTTIVGKPPPRGRPPQGRPPRSKRDLFSGTEVPSETGGEDGNKNTWI